MEVIFFLFFFRLIWRPREIKATLPPKMWMVISSLNCLSLNTYLTVQWKWINRTYKRRLPSHTNNIHFKLQSIFRGVIRNNCRIKARCNLHKTRFIKSLLLRQTRAWVMKTFIKPGHHLSLEIRKLNADVLFLFYNGTYSLCDCRDIFLEMSSVQIGRCKKCYCNVIVLFKYK